jgi:6,7-dimethyl-8-ribityllumazine synthase
MTFQTPPDIRIAIVVSRFNEKVTSGLLRGALAFFDETGVSVAAEQIYDAPGAFEIPLIAGKLAHCGKFDGIVCLGCVIKGETAHFEYICEAASAGLMQASLGAGIPLSFGILATYNAGQALARSRDDAHNKGREAAIACTRSINTLRSIATL